MPRIRREKSKTGIYHVIIRGLDKMDIFLDDEDRLKFLEILKKKRENNEFHVLSYCLMDNHIHMLLKEDKDLLDRSIKRIGVSYVKYFNKKYSRIGHLFQDRFKSQPIDDERYLFACCRYIHNNPIKAGVTKKAENFKWSSYNNYLIGKADPGILDIDFILNILSLEKNESIKFFKEFNDYDDNIFLEADTRDTEYNLDLINSILKKYELNIDKFKEINDKKVRNKVIKDLKTNTKTPIRLLSELLGVSKDIIFRA